MKPLKSIWEILPLHYWTGILGGVIYVVWIGLIFYLEGRWHYYHQELLIQKIIFLMIDMPDYLSRFISDILIDRAHDYANGGSVNSIPYRIVGYLLPLAFFVLVGILVGKTSNDPEREVRRRLMIKVFFIFAIFACAFWACFLVFLWAWMN